MSATAPAAPDSLAALIAALRRLPGVGIKSAQRMAYHLLQHERGGARQLARALDQALDGMGHCHSCHNFAEHQDGEDASAVLCPICRDSTRDRSRLCILESPADLAAMERTGAYDGLYYVLMGRLSPLDGIGAQELNLTALLARAADGVVQEVILATSFTAEGEATAHAIGRALRQRGIPTSRLARGVPLGSELEYVDLATIAHALAGRHA